MKGQRITLKGDGGTTIGAYHVTPPGPAKGGLVVAMEIFGVNAHIRDVADGFAADGYEVIAPALYDRAERDFETGYGPQDMARARAVMQQSGFTHIRGDIQAAIDRLRANGRTRIHIVGYCYGGAVAWAAACRCAGLTSAVGYYGRAIIDMVEETPKCPTLLHFGSRDASIPLEWVERIEKTHPRVQVYVYDAEHGFNSDRRQNYDEAAAGLARARTLAHFEGAAA